MELIWFPSLSRKLHLFLNISFLFLLFFYLLTFVSLGQSKNFVHLSITKFSVVAPETKSDGCDALHDYSDYESKCSYVRTQIGCRPKGYINYLELFYCTCGRFPVLGYLLLLLWLLLLFYILGDTAANYFCTSLASLSKVLKLSPAIAGITLLALGNGASDVFASIVSFTRSGNGDFGLNGILGGAFFVSNVVVGIISLSIGPREISVDKPSFIRDVLFFLFSLSSLLLILFIGRITLWGALSFVSIYFLYVFFVSASLLFNKKKEVKKVKLLAIPAASESDDFAELGIPLLGYVDEEDKYVKLEKDRDSETTDSQTRFYFRRLLYVLELPLSLPRRVTIPVISGERWSRPYAVISATMAPILLAELCNSQNAKNMGFEDRLGSYMIAGLIGILLGSLAFATTKSSDPPEKCLLPWLVGGFLMSVTWTYFTAEEMVSLLVSIGSILGISPSVLGLTVLAWGNSLGDLISNATLAMNGGADGVQTALSGCIAGPMFNTLVGLGVSLVCSSWAQYPSPFVVPEDPSLYETLGFLMAGLLWSLVILPRNNMKLGKFLGGGLLAIYLCFLSLRLARALGLLQLQEGFV